ncbi:MAG: NAD(P)H-hydrate dehydratase [Defluviitaleaceae bacterium]|nr:NAD(P)H-hydrate dehydratase [Defluviitaleaceae bacterium]
MLLVTTKQMQEIERHAIKTFEMPSLLLMENAAIQTVKHVIKMLNGKKRVAVICGHGANGGDGCAIARLLHSQGFFVRVAFVGNKKMPPTEPANEKPPADKGTFTDTFINQRIVSKMGLVNKSLQETLLFADVIVDAIYGTGLKGAVTGVSVQAINYINSRQVPVVSVDMPSGVEADTGHVGTVAVKATLTVTFEFAKIGLILFPGAEYAGQIAIEPISIPKESAVFTSPVLETVDNIKKMLPVRHARSHKGTYGRICVLAGSADMPGAAMLCCKASYKAGAGLVNACVVDEVAHVIKTSVPEVVISTVPHKNGEYFDFAAAKDSIDKAKIIVIGPGIGRSSRVKNFVQQVIQYAKTTAKPLILDADALVAIADNLAILKNLQAPCVITPHPGEMSILTGYSISQILENLVAHAQDFAQKHGVITLLKDVRTIIASPNGRTFVNLTGSPALAKAGSGDVLTGIIAALVAQGTNAHLDTAAAAYIHGKAGEIAAENMSVYSVTATDVIDYIGSTMLEVTR